MAEMDGSLSLSLIFDLCPVGLLLTRDRRIIECNELFAASFGYTKDEILGESIEVLYPSKPEFERVLTRGVPHLQNEGTYGDERLMRKKGGQLQWFRVVGKTGDRSRPLAEAVWLFEPIRSGSTAEQLSPREREVLASISQGLTSKQAAKELGLSYRTVENVRADLRLRFGVKNMAELLHAVSRL